MIEINFETFEKDVTRHNYNRFIKTLWTIQVSVSNSQGQLKQSKEKTQLTNFKSLTVFFWPQKQKRQSIVHYVNPSGIGPFQRHVCDQKSGNFTLEWLQLLVQTCYQQVFDW